MPLFLVLREGLTLNEALTRRLREAIKSALSARHLPSEILLCDFAAQRQRSLPPI